jgi:mRNA degradation ribonuclease J1/J2
MVGAEKTITNAINNSGQQGRQLRKKVQSALAKYLYAETGRRPMVHAVIR